MPALVNNRKFLAKIIASKLFGHTLVIFDNKIFLPLVNTISLRILNINKNHKELKNGKLKKHHLFQYLLE